MNKILLRIAFIVALIIAIALIALVIIRYSPRFFSYVSTASASLFNVFKKETLIIEVSRPMVVSGERVMLSWSNDLQESVSLTYDCDDRYTLSYLGNSNARMPIRCDEAFELGGTTDSVTIIPTLTQSNSFSDIEIFIDQGRSDGKRASGTAIVTVSSGVAPTDTVATTSRPTLIGTTTQATTSRPVAPTRPSTGGPNIITTPVVSGPANLSLSQPQYVQTIGPAVQFTVSNNGGRNSGTWELRASLPNGDIFNSGALSGIPVGGSTFFTLNLGTIARGTNTIRISVDPNNAISESNESDNIREISFNDGTGGGTPTSGKADLSVRVLSIGYVGNSDEIGIRFEIRNSGGATAKDWRFEAELPNDDEDTFESNRQPDLKSGEAIEYTLRFDNPRANGYATIEVDTEDEVDESNERNNEIRFRVTN